MVMREADSLIFTVEKTLTEHSDKLSAEDRQEVETALEKCKESKDKSDNPEEIRSAITALSTASHKIAEHMYKDASPEGAAAGGGCGGQSCGTEEAAAGKTDDTVEAEFEEEEPVGK